MNLLLVSANREHFPDPVFPLGLAYAAEAIRDGGHEITVTDLAFSRNPEATLRDAILEKSPNVVAFSFRNLDNAAYPLTRWYLPSYRNLVRTVRETAKNRSPCRGRAPTIIAGGSAFGLIPGPMLESLEADFGVAGESEEAFPALLRALENGDDPLGIPGVYGRGSPSERSPFERNPVPMSFSRPPGQAIGQEIWTKLRPARDLFDVRRYVRSGGMLNIQTRRGCAFRCRYCTYPLLEGQDHRLRDPDDVADEIEELVDRYRVRSYFFVDSVFNLPVSHAEHISESLIRRKLGIRWSAYASPSGLTRGLLEKMKAAGCDGLEVGTDSADATTLSTLGKGFSRDRILEVAEDCHRVGIPLCHSLIFGGPGETPDTVKNTCRTIEKTRPTAVVAMAGVRLYPGTPLGEWALESGLVREERDFLSPTFYLDPSVKSFLIPYLHQFSSARGNWILPGVTPPIAPTTQKFIRFLGYQKPLWHLLRYGVLKDRVYRDR